MRGRLVENPLRDPDLPGATLCQSPTLCEKTISTSAIKSRCPLPVCLVGYLMLTHFQVILLIEQ